MEYKDYYRTLGVERNASAADIKRVYRRLAKELHPDVNPGDKSAEARFKDINEAYEVLGDPEKRAKYDQLGASWQQWQRAGRDPGGFDWSQWFTPGAGRPPRGGVRVDLKDLSDLFGGGAGGGFSDFFTTLFGEMPQGDPGRGGYTRTRSRPARPQHIEQAIDITLAEAFAGTTRTLVRDGQRIQAKIPPGSRSGTKIRLAGQGAPGMGGERGDLYLQVTVLRHDRFRREGDDLHADSPIDLYTAVLGGEALVETLGDNLNLKIPAGTQNGTLFRLRGKGMPKLQSPNEYGDLYVRINVQIPESLSERETQLFQQLASIRKR